MNKIEEVSMRDTFGESLVELGQEFPEIVVLDADVSSSTQTIRFGKVFPDRFFNVGVAEANMADIASGLALCGYRPVASTFAIFLSLKATEQIANVICYNKLPVILVGSYAGLSDSFDGASHQSINDIAIMRSMPGMNVIVPADAFELTQVLREVIKQDNPSYIRICRNPTPILFGNGYQFRMNKINRIKTGRDITLAALEAADELNRKGISADVLNITTIKPFDTETLISSVKKTGRIITIEEHSIIGGLGSAVAEALTKYYPVKADFIGINDTFAETGPYIELLKKYNISTEYIIRKSIAMLGK